MIREEIGKGNEGLEEAIAPSSPPLNIKLRKRGEGIIGRLLLAGGHQEGLKIYQSSFENPLEEKWTNIATYSR